MTGSDMRAGRLPAGEKIRLLSAADIFRGLTDADMERIGAMTVMEQCSRGQTVYSPTGARERLFLVKRGRVQMFRLTEDGRKVVLSTMGEGTVFGDMAFTGDRDADTYAEAIEDSVVCVMSRTDINVIIQRYPVVGVELVRLLSERVRELEDRLEEVALRDVSARVAAALTRLHTQQGDVVAMTHQDVADLIGAHRETVTRALGALRERGLIGMQRGQIAILDAEALRTVAGHPAEFSAG